MTSIIPGLLDRARRWPILAASALTLLPVIGCAIGAEAGDIHTSDVNTAFLQDQDDVSQVTQVVLRERQGRDRGWWDQMMTTYWPDSRVDLSWYHGDGPGFVLGSKAVYERGARPVHRMFNPAVDIDGNRAHVEVHAMTFSTLEYEDQTLYHNAFMRLNYRLEKRNAEWRIAGFAVVYESSQMGPSQPGTPNPIPVEELDRYRPTYAALSWNLAQRGIILAQDELGDDRPGELRDFYAAVKRWVNGGEYDFAKPSWDEGYRGD